MEHLSAVCPRVRAIFYTNKVDSESSCDAISPVAFVQIDTAEDIYDVLAVDQTFWIDWLACF